MDDEPQSVEQDAVDLELVELVTRAIATPSRDRLALLRLINNRLSKKRLALVALGRGRSYDG